MKLYIEENFWEDLYKRLNRCEETVYMQFMTFEGDKTGLELSSKLIELAKQGIKINLLIDTFSDFYISDKFFTNPTIFKESLATKKMMLDMKKAGIVLKRTRPFGFLAKNFLARNHKKIIIIDDYVYLGGVNISDHNRVWFDFMIGISDGKILKSIKKDFEATFSGQELDLKENNIYTGKNVEAIYTKLIINAQEEIIVSSPYIIDFFNLKLFRQKLEIKKSVFTVENNNIKIINKIAPYILSSLQKINTEISFYKEFSHAKFLLVDKKYLLVGSSNFNQDSFLLKQEIALLIEDKEFIDNFYDDIIKKAKVEKSKKIENTFISQFLAYLMYFVLFFYTKFIIRNIVVLKKDT